MSDSGVDIDDVVACVQEGDVETIKSSLESHLISARACQADGCSLLHWAAINNRIELAQLLIKYGAESVPGGILGETPVHWALRKKYYYMVSILYEQLHCDLSVKSKQCLTPLQLCVRLGDYNGVFLLLTYGQDANCVDNDNLTPILWLIKHNNSAKGLEMIRLLMQFGGSVTIPFSTPENDSILHYLTRNVKRLDLYLIFVVYHSNPSYFQNIQNSGGVSVYQLAVQLENRKMAKFLLDSMLFHFLPQWIVILQSASLVFSLWLFLSKVGIFWGSFNFFILTMIITWLLQQRSIIIYRDRVPCGLILGYFISLPVLLYMYRSLSLFSSAHTFLLTTLYVIIIYLGVHCRNISKSKGGSENYQGQGVLVTRVVSSAPREGTDEEYIDNNNNHNSGNNDKSGKGSVKVVKDRFTGRVSLLRPSTGSGHNHNASGDVNNNNDGGVNRGRSPGPRICSHCLLDKRPLSSTNSSGGSGEPLVHCQHSCQTCHTLRDHHCSYLMTCITITNRRLFVGLHSLAAVFLYVIYLDVCWIETAVLCDNNNNFQIQFNFTCLCLHHPVILLFGYLTLLLSIYSMCVGVILQLFLIARHMTVSMIMKNKRSLWMLSGNKGGLWKGMKRVGTFLRTGKFKVSYSKLNQFDAIEEATTTAPTTTATTATTAAAPAAIIASSSGATWLNRLEQQEQESNNHSTSSHSHYSNHSITTTNTISGGRIRRDSYTREAPTTTTASLMIMSKKKQQSSKTSSSSSRRVTFHLENQTAAVNRVINTPPSSTSMSFEEEKEMLLDDDEEDDDEEEYDDDDYISNNDTDSDNYDSAEEDANSNHRDLEAADDDDRQKLLPSSPRSRNNNSNGIGSFLRWR